MSLEGTALRLYHKYTLAEGLSRSQRNERRLFAWQIKLAESKMEDPSVPTIWIGTCDGSLLLVVTTLQLTFIYTTYTIITERDGLVSLPLRTGLMDKGVNHFIESQDISKPPWNTSRHLWLYSCIKPLYIIQLDVCLDLTLPLPYPEAIIDYTKRILYDILEGASYEGSANLPSHSFDHTFEIPEYNY